MISLLHKTGNIMKRFITLIIAAALVMTAGSTLLAQVDNKLQNGKTLKRGGAKRFHTEQQMVDLKASGKVKNDNIDEEIFEKMRAAVGDPQGRTTAEIIIDAAKYLLGTPYVAGTLEQQPERLIINLHQTDCILFAEGCLGFAITIKSKNPSFSHFREVIKGLRYRDGIVNGYTSRIHYTSEWMSQAFENGYLTDMSKVLCNTVAPNRFAYMSRNPDKYKQLKNSTNNVEKIRSIEQRLNGEVFYYIPKERVESILPQLRSGDIVGFNTTTEGIDISHVGIIYVENNRVGFIHASYTEKKVVIEKRTLLEYINSFSTNNGIRIARPN